MAECSRASQPACDRYIPPPGVHCPHLTPIVVAAVSGRTYIRCRGCDAALELVPKTMEARR